MFQFIAHLRFLTKASNQHGVHSPFIYNYVTKCLYIKGKLHQQKSKNVLLKSIAYFKPEKVFTTSEEIKKTIQKVMTKLNFTSNTVDLAYLELPNIEEFNTIKHHNNTMVFIHEIYTNKETLEAWEQIKKLEKVTVTVDLFYCAIVFFRKEQAKEHFKIRI
ncbi:hypothetical protein M4I21_08950 [Cellulophaga sp. 20_2_10]|uniref:hypothetical protein n=1 Tax=Cellulophaga sp. 20_2_10 TaxID=2942476 RepID=UPI00201A6946|nr:hypothetical protein [Cellulophaga sp. 20_2_10]MCL5245930.1 hypothetical protein [Cellulophaga sp. 20_2_10]